MKGSLKLLKRARVETDTSIAEYVLANIRDVDPPTLKKIKHELRCYDISTKKWDQPRTRKPKVIAAQEQADELVAGS